MDKVESGKYEFKKDDWRYVSEDAKNLINNMLKYNPAQRYSAQQCLKDTWFTKFSKESKVEPNELIQCLNNMKTFNVIRLITGE